jgi:hypothetical protein
MDRKMRHAIRALETQRLNQGNKGRTTHLSQLLGFLKLDELSPKRLNKPLRFSCRARVFLQQEVTLHQDQIPIFVKGTILSIADRTITVAAVGVTVGILDKHNRVIGMVTILSLFSKQDES